MKILSIDAWREQDGWTWNNWFTVGEISKEAFEKLYTPRQYLKWFRDNGFLLEGSKGKCSIDDDQYNIVVCDRSNGRPLYAIEYGPEY